MTCRVLGTRARIMEIMTGHYRIMSEILADHAPEILTGDGPGKAAEYLDLAIAVTTTRSRNRHQAVHIFQRR